MHKIYNKVMDYDPQPVAKAIDPQTFLVRVPSCEGRNPTFAWVDSAAVAYKKSKCPYLILDVRGNAGGSDAIWLPFFRLLLDKRPLHPWQSVFRKTTRNTRIFEYIPNDSDGLAFKQKVEKYKGEFVPLSDDGDDDVGFEPDTSLLRKCAIIIDNRTASSAETLVRFARDFSSRAKIYGQDNTSGAQASGNILSVKLPHSGVVCDYPTTVDLNFKQQINSGQRGIAPDVCLSLPLPSKLNSNIDSWTLWVASDLQR